MTHIHTPGPWRVRRKEQKHTVAWNIQAKFGDGPYKNIFKGNHYRDEEANAQLIAAAPDLLEALENLAEKSDLILSEINSFDSGWYYQFQAAVQQARQALAKATGDHQANHEEGAR